MLTDPANIMSFFAVTLAVATAIIFALENQRLRKRLKNQDIRMQLKSQERQLNAKTIDKIKRHGQIERYITARLAAENIDFTFSEFLLKENNGKPYTAVEVVVKTGNKTSRTARLKSYNAYWYNIPHAAPITIINTLVEEIKNDQRI